MFIFLNKNCFHGYYYAYDFMTTIHNVIAKWTWYIWGCTVVNRDDEQIKRMRKIINYFLRSEQFFRFNYLIWSLLLDVFEQIRDQHFYYLKRIKSSILSHFLYVYVVCYAVDIFCSSIKRLNVLKKRWALEKNLIKCSTRFFLNIPRENSRTLHTNGEIYSESGFHKNSFRWFPVV
jgi:hypothetical protein